MVNIILEFIGYVKIFDLTSGMKMSYLSKYSIGSLAPNKSSYIGFYITTIYSKGLERNIIMYCRQDRIKDTLNNILDSPDIDISILSSVVDIKITIGDIYISSEIIRGWNSKLYVLKNSVESKTLSLEQWTHVAVVHHLKKQSIDLTDRKLNIYITTLDDILNKMIDNINLK